MKTLKLSIMAFSAAFAMSTFTGCTKGDTGATGAAGATGPTGATGAQGTTGNANVATATYSVTAWSYDGPHGDWYASFNDTSITSTIANSGAVEVFLSIDGGYSWNALPSVFVSGTDTNANWTFGFTAGTVDVYFTWDDLQAHSNPNAVYGMTCRFNIIAIAPAMHAKHPGTNWKNPSEVALLPEVHAALYGANQ